MGSIPSVDTLGVKPVFRLANLFARTKSECDWLVMTSVFVASQSSCFFLCTREQIRQVENRLKVILISSPFYLNSWVSLCEYAVNLSGVNLNRIPILVKDASNITVR